MLSAILFTDIFPVLTSPYEKVIFCFKITRTLKKNFFLFTRSRNVYIIFGFTLIDLLNSVITININFQENKPRNPHSPSRKCGKKTPQS